MSEQLELLFSTETPVQEQIAPSPVAQAQGPRCPRCGTERVGKSARKPGLLYCMICQGDGDNFYFEQRVSMKEAIREVIEKDRTDWVKVYEKALDSPEPPVIASDITEKEVSIENPDIVIDQHVELEKNGQIPLINIGEWWEEHWKQMPEFVQKDLEPWAIVCVYFESREDMESFSKLVGQNINLSTKSIWYPEAEIGRFAHKRYVDAS